MKPYYEHEGITIYHGDCREVFPQLDVVDLILTDPQYGISQAGVVNDRSARLSQKVFDFAGVT
jgi:DNA modification methylase